MTYDLQKPTVWKRFSAYFFDIVLIITLSIGFAAIISGVVGFDKQYKVLNSYYTQYGEEYEIDLNISTEDYEKLSEKEKQEYDTTYKETLKTLYKDQDFMKTYSLIINLILIMSSLGILLAVLVWEFFIPLLFKNGQTLGKKIFGIAVMRTNGVKISTLQLFIRAILGKYTFEIMLPVFAITLAFLVQMWLFGIVVVIAIAIAQIICIFVTKNTRQALHDLLSDTVTIDLASQLIFNTEEELIKYKEEQHAKMVERSPY